MKTLVIGYGSIGSRHTRILETLGYRAAVVSRREVDVTMRFSNLKAALSDWKPDYVVVANRTDEHFKTVNDLIYAGYRGRLLIEKPLFKIGAKLPPHRFSHAVVAYNLRCHPLIKALKKKIDTMTGLVTAHIHTGSYLPDWRPKRDYRDSYSASKKEGGGVLRDLSHELDYAGFLFGTWKRLTARGGNSGSLEIDSEDHYSIMMETQKVPLVAIHINYLDRIPARQIRITAADESIHADFMSNTLTINGRSDYLPVDRDDTYTEQHRRIIEGRTTPLCSLEEGMEIMETIAAAEHAAQTTTWIER